MRSNAPVVWTVETEQAFEAMKNNFANATLLAHPLAGAPVRVTVDASDYAMGATLQQCVDGEWQPLAFYTKALATAQRNYSAYDREVLAAHAAVKRFLHFLEVQNFHYFYGS